MCRPVPCSQCHKTTWAGCGQHIEEALRDVPPEKRCTCPRDANQLDPDEVKPSVLRLKRASGQLNAVIRMLEDGRDCEEVITQIAAVSKAIDRAGYSIIAHGMRTCLLNDPTGESVNAQKLEKLFLSLS